MENIIIDNHSSDIDLLADTNSKNIIHVLQDQQCPQCYYPQTSSTSRRQQYLNCLENDFIKNVNINKFFICQRLINNRLIEILSLNYLLYVCYVCSFMIVFLSTLASTTRLRQVSSYQQ